MNRTFSGVIDRGLLEWVDGWLAVGIGSLEPVVDETLRPMVSRLARLSMRGIRRLFEYEWIWRMVDSDDKRVGEASLEQGIVSMDLWKPLL